MFPTSPAPEYASTEEYIIPIVKTESDGNYLRVRRKTTKKRETFTLKFVCLHSGYDSIRTFFDTWQGTAFTWTHPTTGVVHTVVFGQDKLTRSVRPTHSEFSIILEEL
jgi:hypothetical protein